MTLVVRAPASTANLGPGFDCAAAALELWNEVYVTEGEAGIVVEGEGAHEIPHDEAHLALRAFSLIAPPDGYGFRFVNRIPLERGLGASAATIAVGLVAAASLSGRELSDDELLDLGLPLEGHPDNLAAALRGGVCLIWRNGAGSHVARIATDLPLAPIIVVPRSRVNTLESRDRLPRTLTHGEAAAAAAQAALLGAAIASGDAELLADAFHDRLHEPYRLQDAPLLEMLRDDPVAGQQGVTLSGSGPTVVVWADKANAESVARQLDERFHDAQVLPLEIAQQGAH
jgi:homoserine kinase